jgi:hypothetical protein
VTQAWATEIPKPVVTPDQLAKFKNLGLALSFLTTVAFGETITEDQADQLINIAKTQSVTAEFGAMRSAVPAPRSKRQKKAKKPQKAVPRVLRKKVPQ